MAHQGGEDEYPSETMYAFRQSMKIGSDSLELDIGVTKDDKVIVMHDTTVNRITNGTGNVSDLTLAQIKALDGAYWFSPTGENGNHYSHNLPASAYPFRGVATGAKPAPKGRKNVAALGDDMYDEVCDSSPESAFHCPRCITPLPRSCRSTHTTGVSRRR